MLKPFITKRIFTIHEKQFNLLLLNEDIQKEKLILSDIDIMYNETITQLANICKF